MKYLYVNENVVAGLFFILICFFIGEDPSLGNEEDSMGVMEIENEELNFVQAEVIVDLRDFEYRV